MWPLLDSQPATYIKHSREKLLVFLLMLALKFGWGGGRGGGSIPAKQDYICHCG